MSVTQESATVVRVVGRGPSDLEEASRRFTALREVRHPGVCLPDRLEMRSDGTVVAAMPRVRGEDAAVVVRLRGGLSLGESVAVGIDVAEALAALHSRGLAHGDVSPANIVVSPIRSVLVDTLSGARQGERGTVGFAAPERARGATPASDVYSLGRVLETLIEPAGRERMAAWVEPLCRPDPGARPLAEVVARALRDCAEPSPVSVPVVSVVAAVRARAVEPERTTTRLASGRMWRVRRTATVALRWLGVGGLGLLVFTLGARLVGAVLPEAQSNYLPNVPIRAEVLHSVHIEAAETLLEARIAALSSSDFDTLLGLTTFDGSAHAEDQPVADRLASGELRYEGLSIRVASTEVLLVEGKRATVRMRYEVSEHVVWDGGERLDLPATTSATDFDITLEDGTWRIERMRPCL